MKPARAIAAPAVLYRDDDLLVLDKPAFLPTTSPDGGDCLVKRAEKIDPRAERLHPTSRLDAEVTGIVTFARTTRAIASITASRASGTYRRRYLGLAGGVLTQESLRWEGAIAIDPRDARRRVIAETVDAKASLTIAEPDGVLDGATLLVLWPKTGRTHQLRLHASHAGYPLLGDAHYGGARRIARSSGRMVAFSRVMLHCTEVVLPRVDGQGVITLASPLAKDFIDAFAALGGDAEVLANAAIREPR